MTERALATRLTRTLRAEGLALKKCRTDSQWFSECGAYYVIDVARNVIEAKHVDLEAWARECGCLAAREALAPDAS